MFYRFIIGYLTVVAGENEMSVGYRIKRHKGGSPKEVQTLHYSTLNKGVSPTEVETLEPIITQDGCLKQYIS